MATSRARRAAHREGSRDGTRQSGRHRRRSLVGHRRGHRPTGGRTGRNWWCWPRAAWSASRAWWTSCPAPSRCRPICGTRRRSCVSWTPPWIVSGAWTDWSTTPARASTCGSTRSDSTTCRPSPTLNVYAPLLAMQAVIPPMRRQGGGAIVNVSSMTSRMVLPGAGAYSATKAALTMLSQVAQPGVGAGRHRGVPGVPVGDRHGVPRLTAGRGAGGR